MTSDVDTLRKIHNQLHEALLTFEKRLNWLLNASRLHFGVVTGRIVGLLIDSVHATPDELTLFYFAIGKFLSEPHQFKFKPFFVRLVIVL